MNVVMELGSTGAVKSAVEAGVGITMLSPSSVQHELALGLVHIVDIRGLEFKKAVLCHPSKIVLVAPVSSRFPELSASAGAA